MVDPDERYYTPSLRVPPAAFAVTLLSSILTLPGAWLYAWLCTSLLPRTLILLHILFIAGFALWIGVVAWTAATVAKVRNPRKMGCLGLIIGLVGWYFHWAVYAVYASARSQAAVATDLGTFVEMATQPLHLFGAVVGPVMIEFSDHPALVTFRFLSWLVELLLLVGAATVAGSTRAADPFCEKTNSWAKANHLPYLFALVTTREKAIERLEAEPAQIFSMLAAPVEDSLCVFCKVTLYSCAEGDVYVTIRSAKSPHPGTDKQQKSTRFLVEALRIDVDPEEAVRMFADAAQRVPPPPELLSAVEALEAEQYQLALDVAVPHISAERLSLRTDALRLAGLANARLERWGDSRQCWLSLYSESPSARHALEIATSSVMAGEVDIGEKWVAKAQELNTSDHTLRGLTIITGYLSALTRAGQMKLALPYLEQLKECYESSNTTDDHFLWSRGVPFFETFIEKSAVIVREVLDVEQGRAWYASMLPHLDERGREALNDFLSTWPREVVGTEG
jgi:hypothetical protein